MFFDIQQRLSCSHLHHVHEARLVHECVAPIYPLVVLCNDCDHGRDRDGDLHNGNGHDDCHDHDGDDVRHGYGHGYFCFPHLYS